MNEKNDMMEGTEESLELEPADEAKESMRQAVEAAAEEAEPQPATRIDDEADRPADRPADEEPEEPVVEDEQATILDLNTATSEELQQLPGIGPALAASIVQYREEQEPFKEVAEITRVPGISTATYESLAERLTVGLVETEVRVEETPVLEIEPSEIEEVVEPEPERIEVDEIPTPAPTPRPSWEAPPPQEIGWGRLLLVGLVSALLGAALTLAILYALNGTLDFRGAASRALRTEAQRLEGRFGEVEGALAGMEGALAGMGDQLAALQAIAPQVDEIQARLDDLEQAQVVAEAEIMALSEGMEAMHTALGQMGEQVALLEGDFGVLGRQVNETEWQIGVIKEQLKAVTDELDDLRQITERFDTFLHGLRELLSSALEEEPAPPLRRGTPTPTPWITRTPWHTPTPTPWETPTPASLITVIPLTTPTATPTP